MYLLLLSLTIVPGILGSCLRIPVQDLPSPCLVRNLTIVDTSGRKISNDNICNGTVYSAQLIDPPSVNFSLFYGLHYQNSTFLLVFVDSSKELLWMVGNITTKNNRLVPNFQSPASVTIKPYIRPDYSGFHRTHEIDVYVFEVRGNAASLYVPAQEIFSFNLTKWLGRQLSYGNQICGPVAATKFTVVNSSLNPNSNPSAGQQNPALNGVWTPQQTPASNIYPALFPINGSGYNSNVIQRPVGNGNFYPSHANQQGKSSKPNAASCLHSNLLILILVIGSTFKFID